MLADAAARDHLGDGVTGKMYRDQWHWAMGKKIKKALAEEHGPLVGGLMRRRAEKLFLGSEDKGYPCMISPLVGIPVCPVHGAAKTLCPSWHLADPVSLNGRA